MHCGLIQLADTSVVPFDLNAITYLIQNLSGDCVRVYRRSIILNLYMDVVVRLMRKPQMQPCQNHW